MSKVNIFLANGFEEIEALTVVDILRRGGVEVSMVSVTGQLEVTGSHHITVKADCLFDDMEAAEVLVLPGGIPGTPNLKAHEGLCALLRAHYEAGKMVAAICAAPTVFGALGFLEGRTATCFPGMEDGLAGATHSTQKVVVDGNVVTSRGMGTAMDFGLKLLELLKDEETAKALAHKIVYEQ
ncbi:MAG: DJ-1 family glyoxalase III [Wujia sp.]